MLTEAAAFCGATPTQPMVAAAGPSIAVSKARTAAS
jgi:hypothetical protein